jgi:uncharacterized protein (TIGR00661 family)
MKIVYGVAGEGMGHAIRSKPIIEHLTKKHEVVVVTGGKSHPFLSKFFKTIEIPSLRISFSNNKIRPIRTFFNNIIRIPHYLKGYYSLFKHIKQFNPDVVISDFEPLTNYNSFIHKKPLISISNQQISTNTAIDKEGHALHRFFSNTIIKLFSPKADYYFIPTFFFPKVTKKNTFLFSPILRNEILNLNPSKGEHFLVYLSTEDNNSISFLKNTDLPFIVYGLNKEKKEKNVIFKKFSEKQFIKDMAYSKAVICNGGANTICEALYFHKPVLSIPIEGHHEQFLNAFYIEKLGFGHFAEKFNEGSLTHFVKNLRKYESKLKTYSGNGNSLLFKKLDYVLKNFKV